jgi:segregation and condensation protein B
VEREASKRPVGTTVVEVEVPGEAPVQPGLPDEDAAAFAEEAARAAARAALADEVSGAEEPPADEPVAGKDGDDGLPGEELAAGEAEVDALSGEESVVGEEEVDALRAEELAAGEGEVDGLPPEELPTAEEALAAREDRATPEEEALAQQSEGEPAPEGETLDGIVPAQIDEAVEEAGPSFSKLAAKAAKLSPEQAKNLIHAVLFVSDKPLTVDQLRQATGLETRRLKKLLDGLSGQLREGVSGVILSEVGGAWQLRTAPETAEWIRRFLQVKPKRLTRAALETLAIVAYRQPVTRPEIEEIRGVDCGAVLKALIDWKLLKILGRKDEVGRPILYGTTREFLEFFQLKDLASLPTLREFHELSEESRQIVEEELGADAVESIEGTVSQLSDPGYLEAEKERVAASEAALADLEKAMAETETKAESLAAAIAPPKPPSSEGAAPPAGETPPEA